MSLCDYHAQHRIHPRTVKRATRPKPQLQPIRASRRLAPVQCISSRKGCLRLIFVLFLPEVNIGESLHSAPSFSASITLISPLRVRCSYRCPTQEPNHHQRALTNRPLPVLSRSRVRAIDFLDDATLDSPYPKCCPRSCRRIDASCLSFLCNTPHVWTRKTLSARPEFRIRSNYSHIIMFPLSDITDLLNAPISLETPILFIRFLSMFYFRVS